ncbi:TPA: ImmA/IrrE family metallo-endopeptidase [Escherichia coli]|nr:ImmA/IrrE family metallo-endopeptidase [Escherichia coli]
MTPVSIVQERDTQREVAALIQREGVTARFFFGDVILEGFSIIHDNTPYVVINTALPVERQRHVAHRELAHIRLHHLQEGTSSLFLSDFEKYQAEAEARKGIAL